MTSLHLIEPGPRDWVEDFDHENGQYISICCMCSRDFIGHKRRPVCKECAQQPTLDEYPGGAS